MQRNSGVKFFRNISYVFIKIYSNFNNIIYTRILQATNIYLKQAAPKRVLTLTMYTNSKVIRVPLSDIQSTL